MSALSEWISQVAGVWGGPEALSAETGIHKDSIVKWGVDAEELPIADLYAILDLCRQNKYGIEGLSPLLEKWGNNPNFTYLHKKVKSYLWDELRATVELHSPNDRDQSKLIESLINWIDG